MTIDIDPLRGTIDRLGEGLARYELDVTDEQIRDGLIQRFEFTYELTHRMLKRYLESVSPSPEQFDAMPFQDVIRTGNEQGLLVGDWPMWRTHRELRNRTSHSYDEKIALQVVAGIPAFLTEAAHLRDQLEQRLA